MATRQKQSVSPSEPLNLSELFDKRFVVTTDPSITRRKGVAIDPWYYQIPAKYGHAYPVSGTTVGLWCDSGVIMARMQRECKAARLLQDGDGEGVFGFDPKDIDKIDAFARFRKRRRPSKKGSRKPATGQYSRG